MSDARPATWLAAERTELATERILDVAEELFVEHGVAAVSMRQLATAVGCSRATLYRYFPGKSEVLAAYVDRATRDLADSIGAAVADESDPSARLRAAVLGAVTGVRANPALIAWFSPDTAGTSSHLALLSPRIEAVASRFLTTLLPGADDIPDRARWLVRVIVSLLTTPGVSPDDERTMLDRFVIPVIIDSAPAHVDSAQHPVDSA
ncbi:TetR/AcrR family transcriptional regulator [Gordonia sp. CPCC 205515]|uniref:TetR/AcrR family transcriptional regulator n=1 Tax=Gordonia sp. CPCC 205515 TaxID=3140791 RepID=UPI003AF3D2D1